jgi:formylglycine-generating enzyme required for sulfatase activity
MDGKQFALTKSLICTSTFSLCIFFPVSGTADELVSYPLADGRSVVSLESFRECDHCPEMIVMPPGSFMMGAIPGESRNPFDFYGENASLRVRGPDEVNIIPNEHPRHRVEMDIPYAISRNEITHAEWMACVEGGGCTHVPDHRVPTLNGYVPLGPDHPVIDVSYLEALEYVAWLNTLVGKKVYRLPT